MVLEISNQVNNTVHKFFTAEIEKNPQYIVDLEDEPGENATMILSGSVQGRPKG